MADPRRESGSGQSERTTGGSESTRTSKSGPERGQQSKTAGTNRDFDETQESQNQGHGHPREERETGGKE